jgi:hypothetical protein
MSRYMKRPHYNKNKKVIVGRLTSLSEASSFDSEFWQKQTPQARFVATWKTIDEFYKIKGINGYKLRLQRSIQNIKQA